MILLDTNILIDYFRAKQPATKFIDKQPKANLAICSVVALIAATALVFDLELKTHNLKDFQFIPTLKVSSDLE